MKLGLCLTLAALTLGLNLNGDSVSVSLANHAFAQAPVTQKVYLDTGLSSSPLIKYLNSTYVGTTPTVTSINKAIADSDNDSAYQKLKSRYHEDLLKLLEIGDGRKFSDIDAWKTNNKQIAKGIALYVESPEDGEPVWQIINQKLRSGKVLTASEKKNLDTILLALDKIPAIRGISFRGAGLKPEYLTKYKKGSIITEPSFTSASVDVGIANGYADMSNPSDFNGKPTAGRISTIFIIKAKSASPVTAFMVDYYFELEMLLKPASKFKVHHALITAKKAYIILEQI